MTSSAAWQVAFGLIAILAIFALATGAKRTISIGVLLILIPFQTIDTRYGSSSVLIAYALAAVLLLSGGLRLRMMPWLGFIVFAYLVSLSLADRDILQFHLIYMFQLFSCFVVFLLAYNFAALVEDERAVINILLAINVLTIVYCVLQLSVGPGERFVPFGIDEFKFNLNREPGDPRLVGSFGNPGSTAGYFSLMTVVCAVEFMFASGRRRLLVCLVAGLNFFGLVATGNRTGFLVVLMMLMVMLFVYRHVLGARRVLQYAVGGAAVFVLSAIVAVSFTDFNVMFSRMESVAETEGGIPKTRQGGWPVAIEKIKQEPWFGEGPHYWTAENAEDIGQARTQHEDLEELETAFDPYPHSLYLYLLRTVGVLGLVAVVAFFVRCWLALYESLKRGAMPEYRAAIVRLGLLLIPMFMVAQVTLEFIRPSTMDFAQFIFALMGMLVGTCDRVRGTSTVLEASEVPHSAPSVELHRNGSVAR